MRKVYLAGHTGMVGSAIKKKLARLSDVKIVVRSRDELDLTNQMAVAQFFANEKPDEVILAAAKVGGISANRDFPADFIYNNLMIEANVIHQSYLAGVKKLLFLGSSCIYPKEAAQPISEDALLAGKLEPTNEPYAIAKIAGIKLCESYNRQYNVDYRSVMPSNLYGPNDNFHIRNSHVLPALMMKIHEAKVMSSRSVEVWGTGKPRREFLYVDDLADAVLFVSQLSESDYRSSTDPMLSHINVGAGVDISIAELARTLCDVIGFKGSLDFNRTMPDGTARKLMKVDRLTRLGWQPKVSLVYGIRQTYQWYLENLDYLKVR